MKTRQLGALFFNTVLILPIAGSAAAVGPTRESAHAQSVSHVLHLNLGPADPSVDPALTEAWTSSAFVASQLFLGLVRADDETGEPIPDLATSRVMSRDATVFTFTLRTGATWTDGIPVTAYDVHYGILRSLDPGTACHNPLALFVAEVAEEYNGFAKEDWGSCLQGMPV